MSNVALFIIGVLFVACVFSHLLYWRFVVSLRLRGCQNPYWVCRRFRVFIRWIAPLDFPYTILRGIIDTFPVGPVTKQLVASGKFTTNPAGRLVDTLLDFARVGVGGQRRDGTWSPLAEQGFTHMAQQHGQRVLQLPTGIDPGSAEFRGRLEAFNEHFVATLGGMLRAAVQWFDSWGWRPLSHRELELVHAWLSLVAKEMRITGFPATVEDTLDFIKQYEEYWFTAGRDPRGRQIFNATLDGLASLFPFLTREQLEAFFFTSATDLWLEGFQATRPPAETQRAVERFLISKRRLQRLWGWLFPFSILPLPYRLLVWLLRRVVNRQQARRAAA